MLRAGLDLRRRKVDVCLTSEAGEIVDEWASPADVDGLRGLAGALEGTLDLLHGQQFERAVFERPTAVLRTRRCRRSDAATWRRPPPALPATVTGASRVARRSGAVVPVEAVSA